MYNFKQCVSKSNDLVVNHVGAESAPKYGKAMIVYCILCRPVCYSNMCIHVVYILAVLCFVFIVYPTVYIMRMCDYCCGPAVPEIKPLYYLYYITYQECGLLQRNADLLFDVQ